MDVYHWPECGSNVYDASVATLGVFDGVHRGHQQILQRVCQEGKALSMPGVVVTFDRHPSDVLRSEPEPFITSLDHRLQLFDDFGVDVTVVIEFTPDTALMKAPDFARTFFRDLLGVELLILGFDARFGHKAEGDIDLCRDMADELDMRTEQVSPFYVAGDVASSTRVREAVQNANLDLAERLLGRPFAMLGTVVHGEELGRELGYPTANLDVHHELMPGEGVYATLLCWEGETYPSVTSVGCRETFPDLTGEKPVVEVHVLDRSVDLYGRDVKVQFMDWIRSQECYDDVGELVAQIKEDVETARRVLSE